MAGPGHVLQHHCGFKGRVRGQTESKHTMMRQQHGRRLARIFQDGLPHAIANVIHIGRARNLMAKFIRDRRQVRRNRAAQQGKTCGVI